MDTTTFAYRFTNIDATVIKFSCFIKNTATATPHISIGYNLTAYREINISRQTEILKTDTSIKTTCEIRMEVTQFI